MPESQLAIATPRGPEIVACQTGGSIPYGLALTLVPLDFGRPAGWPGTHVGTRWSITHIDSGRRIGPGFEERRDAQRVAESLADLADWSRPMAELLALPDLEDAVREALDRALSEMDERA